nr:MAG TPA: hypothetical protein [Caudoviricetes sp.]
MSYINLFLFTRFFSALTIFPISHFFACFLCTFLAF